MYLPSLAGLSLTGPSHCRPCATDKVVEYEDEEALRDAGGKHLAEFADEPGEPAKPGCAICQLPFEPGRDGGDVIILSCGHAFHLDCMAKWGNKQRAKNLPVKCPLCNKPPTDAEMSELGLGVDPNEKLFKKYLSGDENGWIQSWEADEGLYLNVRPPHFTGDRAGLSYIEAMVQAWARKDGTRASEYEYFLDIMFKGRQKILKRAFEDGAIPEEEDVPLDLSWDEKELVSLFARHDDEVLFERQPWEVQHEGWRAISKRADVDSEFREVFGLVYEAIGMKWDASKTIKYNFFTYRGLFLGKLFSLPYHIPEYRTHLDNWYTDAMSYNFEAPYELAEKLAKNEFVGKTVDIEKLQKLNMLLDKFGGDKVPNATDFLKREDGSFSEVTYSIKDQFEQEAYYLENLTYDFNLVWGFEWDEFLNYDNALTNEEQWKRLDRIFVLDRNAQASPGIYRAELRRLKDMIVTKFEQAKRGWRSALETSQSETSME